MNPSPDVSTPVTARSTRASLVDTLNTRHHAAALAVYAVVVVAHWAEHLAQGFQIYALGWSTKDAGGVLGLVWPWLVSSEWMHYGYAVLMMGAFFLLRSGFTGRSRTWWNAALGIQVWHHFEHLLLLLQALTGSYLLGAAQPTSTVQLVFPRVELHLLYNTIVTIPMVVAIVRHRHPRADEPVAACPCAVRA